MTRFLIAFPWMMHGLAHLSGFIASWTGSSVGFPERPWLLSSGITLQSPVGKVFGLLWLVAGVGIVASGVGFLTGKAWWPTLAMATAGVSLFVILPWLRSVPPGAWAGAAFDLLVLIVLLLPLKERLLALAG
ncbi:MAG: hypothetical protein PVJ07_02850 [Anaerolineales bacterium]|jgi:hypothetical protein